ncbi:heavy metal translocating P-type ATPase [Natronoarchaeum sp. GCM10025321]|uniref:heavy metal translocating P-type ATPase n=1 Tax=Natronoarchaeum sp. GCM10025321 TaxID=3252684 RepID=UPI003A8D11FE
MARLERIKLTVRRNRTAVVAAMSGLFFVVGWALDFATSYQTASSVLLVAGAVVGGFDIAKKAYYTLRSGTVGINTLVTLAAIGAILIGEFWEAAGVVFLFSLGNYLEARTMSKTRTALTELLEMTPDTAVVRRDGEQVEIPAREVETGETVIVKPGANIPVDGEVVDGESAVDQSPVTGESEPVHKAAGDEVYAGTINQEGAIEVVATGTGTDTTLQRIIRRVEAAQEAKAPTETIIERFAKYYTPSIILLAAGTYLVTGNVIMALTLLVIGCPGALVIGPPVSIVSAIGNAARNGILLKGGEHLEQAGKIDVVAFDKTGTLTKGETVVAGVKGFAGDAEEALRLAAIAEQKSEHHLASAILDAARTSGEGPSIATDGGTAVRDVDEEASEPSIPESDRFEVVAGKGVIARYDGHDIAVGNRTLLDERDISIPPAVADHVREREADGETAVHVVHDGVTVGVIALRDELRETAPDVVQALKDSGIRTVMLTGDNERTAHTVADQVGIDDYRAELLPEEKQEAIQSLQSEEHVVAMVGDGINDAPSLATADVGIAMGAAGTDTAIETADMALMADDLERIPEAVSLSKATRRNVFENIGIAVATVGLLLAGVFTGYVHMTTGMLGHIGSVLLVILNGMRLLQS